MKPRALRTSKLKLEINSNALSEPQRALEPMGILLTPPVGENFWLMRVKVSKDQAILGFPKFGVIGVGFAKEKDWNTNLPSGCTALEIYNHIEHNRGSKQITKEKCLEAILLIQDAVNEMHRRETIELLKKGGNPLQIVGQFLRKTGSHEVAAAFGE